MRLRLYCKKKNYFQLKVFKVRFAGAFNPSTKEDLCKFEPSMVEFYVLWQPEIHRETIFQNQTSTQTHIYILKSSEVGYYFSSPTVVARACTGVPVSWTT